MYCERSCFVTPCKLEDQNWRTLPQVLALKMTREPPQSQQRKKATHETHMEEVSKLVPAHIELRGIFLLSLKGVEAGQKAAKMHFVEESQQLSAACTRVRSSKGRIMCVQGRVGRCPKEAIALRSITSFTCHQSGNVKPHNHPKAQTFKIGKTEGKKKTSPPSTESRPVYALLHGSLKGNL